MVWLEAWHMQFTYSLAMAMTIYKSVGSKGSRHRMRPGHTCLQAAWLLTRVTVPETKGRSLEDWLTTWNHITLSSRWRASVEFIAPGVCWISNSIPPWSEVFLNTALRHWTLNHKSKNSCGIPGMMIFFGSKTKRIMINGGVCSWFEPCFKWRSHRTQTHQHNSVAL